MQPKILDVDVRSIYCLGNNPLTTLQVSFLWKASRVPEKVPPFLSSSHITKKSYSQWETLNLFSMKSTPHFVNFYCHRTQNECHKYTDLPQFSFDYTSCTIFLSDFKTFWTITPSLIVLISRGLKQFSYSWPYRKKLLLHVTKLLFWAASASTSAWSIDGIRTVSGCCIVRLKNVYDTFDRSPNFVDGMETVYLNFELITVSF